MISEKMKPYVKNNSAIRMMFEEGNRLRAKYGADKVFDFSLGNPSVPAPDSVREAIIDLVNNTDPTVLHGYMSNAGFEDVRQTIAESLNRRFDTKFSAKNLIMTVGAASGLNVILKTILNPGDQVLMPDPAYLAYPACVRLVGGTPVLVPTFSDDEFRLRVDKLEEKLTTKTKALLIGYPNNPTGTVMDQAALEEIAAFAQRHDLIVISDEIYCDLTYEGKHTCFASIPGMKERTLVMNGFSKSYAMTGLRIGYICGPKEVMQSLYKVHQYEILCAASTSQYGAIAALKKCDEDVKVMFDEYKVRRKIVYDALAKMGLKVFKPKGAFYIFPDISCTGMNDEEFCDRLLMEEKVGVVPGTCFGLQGKNHIRISYAASRENLTEAMKRMAHFVTKYKK